MPVNLMVFKQIISAVTLPDIVCTCLPINVKIKRVNVKFRNSQKIIYTYTPSKKNINE